MSPINPPQKTKNRYYIGLNADTYITCATIPKNPFHIILPIRMINYALLGFMGKKFPTIKEGLVKQVLLESRVIHNWIGIKITHTSSTYLDGC